jgi:hypothetical protein
VDNQLAQSRQDGLIHLMTIQKAISKAIEVGYEPIWKGSQGERIASKYPGEMWLDPLFWQSLGKALGWRDNYARCHRKLGDDNQCVEHGWNNTWLSVWHRFIDHLAEGKKILRQKPIKQI